MFKDYIRKNIAELRPYVKGESISALVSISAQDIAAGSPKEGDMIARNPKDHDDQWLVAKQYFEDNFQEVRKADTYQERLVIEHDDLAEKLDKLLNALLNTLVPATEVPILLKQQKIMLEYLEILKLRMK